jgi:hypothetical protein
MIKACGWIMVLVAVLTGCADGGRQAFRVENRTGESIDLFLVDSTGTESRVTPALAPGSQGTVGFYLRPGEERCTMADLVARATPEGRLIAERHDWLCIDDSWLVVEPVASP